MKNKYRRKKKSNKTKHHILPTSRGGRCLENNVNYVPKIQHQIYHHLFSNLTPYEIINHLVENYWGGQTKWVDEYLERYHEYK